MMATIKFYHQIRYH